MGTAAEAADKVYVSDEGGFEFRTGDPLVSVQPPRGMLQRSVGVRAANNMRRYEVIATFFMNSLGKPDDMDELFSKDFLAELPCYRFSVEKIEIQGLPARRIHDKCAGSGKDRLYIFAGNRIFKFEGITSGSEQPGFQELMASIRIVDPHFVQPGEWLNFAFRAAGFSAYLPGYPTYRVLETDKGREFVMEDYIFRAQEIPKSTSAPGEELLDAFKQAYTEQRNARVSNELHMMQQGLLVRKFDLEYTDPGGNFHEYCFLMLGERHTYILTVRFASNAAITKATAERFFDSFRLD